MESKKVLYISQEIYPYLPETELSHMSRYLPEHVQNEGHQVRVFVPRYGLINERRNQLHEVIRLSGINVIVDDMDYPLIIKVASIPSARLQVYFIDNNDFFKRKTMFGVGPTKALDNGERMIFFVKGVCEAIRKLRWVPDVVHCVGWFSALAPMYIRHVFSNDPCLNKAKLVFSLSGAEQEGDLSDNLYKIMEYDKITPEMLEVTNGDLSADALRRLAVQYSDGVVLGSDEVSEEMRQFITQSGKPTYQHEGLAEEHADEYRAFYRSLFEV